MGYEKRVGIHCSSSGLFDSITDNCCSSTDSTKNDSDLTKTYPSPVVLSSTMYAEGSADDGGVYDEAMHKVTWKKSVTSGETSTVTFKIKVDKSIKNIDIVNDVHISDGLIDTYADTTTNPVSPKSHESVPDISDNSMQCVLMIASVGIVAVLLAVVAKRYRTSRG